VRRREPGPPHATYRLQISAAFPMTAAAALVPYLRDLGISHLYSSPLMQARRGSTHGYDVVDPTRFDEERGGEAGFAALSAALEEHGLGLLLDVVPNHAAATAENPWWRDVLARGRASPYAAAFDVDWEAPGLEGKVLLPLLGEPYGEALASGALRLVENTGDRGQGGTAEDSDKRFAVAYHEHRLPLSPETAAEADALGLESYGGVAGIERLDAMLARQHYRLAFWRLAGERLDYRRFFDVNDLVGLRVEVPEIFDAVHARLLELRREGKLDGLRIDHVDGLRRPGEYLRRLREALHEAAPDRGECYVVVEKILAAGEELRPDWSCHGTTGYDFDNAVAALFVEPAGLVALDRIWRGATDTTQRFADLRYGRKKQVMAKLFGAELGRLGRKLVSLAAEDSSARDLAPRSLVTALVEVTACLPVYRTYVDEAGPDEVDRERLLIACAEAERRAEPAGERRASELADPVLPPAIAFLRRVLLLEWPAHLADRRGRWLDFVQDWQQATGAVMAKGHEDTALYVHARLLSLNEVGGEPPGVAPPGDADAFHRFNARRRALSPATMNATTTHDTKRSEDAGCRISALSELSREWESLVDRWLATNARLQRRLEDGRVAPDANEQLFLYQTLLGAWPVDAAEPNDDFGERIAAYLRKALREAKTHSSWLAPDEAYEEAVLGFAADLLRKDEENELLPAFRELAERVACLGAWSSLAQVVLKVASPGVPDFYQGTELWDLSLADPDNRRPVDFALRRGLLAKLRRRHDAADDESRALIAELLASWRDGRVKLFATWRALATRTADPELFLAGDYQPVIPEGVSSRHLVSFARAHEGRWLLVVVPRWVSGLASAGEPPIGAATWAETWLPLPREAPATWEDAFTGARLRMEGGRLAAASALAGFPVALLLSRSSRAGR